MPYRIGPWTQIVYGVAMLGSAGLAAFICLSNKIGLGKALGLTLLGVLFAAWLIAGVILVVRGISRL